MKTVRWIPLGGGHLGIGHKPGKKLRAELERDGCTLLVSLLSADETTARATDRRLRFPISGARPPDPDRDIEARAAFDRLDRELARGGRVYVHCSAGLHRTGMFTYGFLRHRGFAIEDARALVRELRSLTASELTEERAAWGDRFARAPEAP